MNPNATMDAATSTTQSTTDTGGSPPSMVPPAVQGFRVQKRDGRLIDFDENRIYGAIEGAFRSVYGVAEEAQLDPQMRKAVVEVGGAAIADALKEVNGDNMVEVETIQDLVETELMKQEHYRVARSYILYRDAHKKARILNEDLEQAEEEAPQITMTQASGARTRIDVKKLRKQVVDACAGFEEVCAPEEIVEEVVQTLYDGVTASEIQKALILSSRSRVEKDPAYSYVAARLLLTTVYDEALDLNGGEDLELAHRQQFRRYLEYGVEHERLTPALLDFDTDKLAAALDVTRDQEWTYLGLQTIYDRYLIHQEERRIETPQYFWMRVSMGLALNEQNKEERAIEFYNVLSSFYFVSSTPTLFNAGTLRPQLSSCYLSTVDDDLQSIFGLISDNASLSKWAGGLGNDWTSIRATNAYIKGTNGKSQGVIPFLKVANDTAVAVNQGGKRKGALCSYLETWHLDIEDFLELRKNTGDERRRTHDMHTANWIPDLFMKRVQANGSWTLFSPDEVPELHHIYGKDFEAKYIEYEKKAEAGELRQHKTVDAVTLWRKMLTMLFETGHPWVTFKDPSNIRSPQDHVGVVHNSNLCTEILLNTSAEETAVCNLGSVNLVKHVDENGLLEDRISGTVTTAMRMLDNVIDINFYPTRQAEHSNKQHRPVGLGMMGFQDALYEMNIAYASDAAVQFADRSTEMISYYAILGSSELAKERGTYQTYSGSKWDRGMLPIDTLKLLKEERGEHLDVDMSMTMDWSKVRDAVKQHGMRNSNTMAIAPTATIANISGISQSIEVTYKNLFVKSNLSGEFTIINPYLIRDLKARDLWDSDMLDDLKYYDGSLLEIERIPEDLQQKYRTAFEVEPRWTIECASRRQKWIDMGQSLNLYLAEPNGKKLNEMYTMAWLKGLKTTYYLRSLGATTVEKSTQDINRRGLQPRWMKSKSASSNIEVSRDEAPAAVPATEAPKACSILDPDCEACQ